jgi:uncharacterized protein
MYNKLTVNIMNPLALIELHFLPGTLAHRVMLAHAREVAGLAELVAEQVNREQPVDIAFVVEAAWLHDIGIGQTYSPRHGCFGRDPYITHGVHGASLLDQAGLPRHALVCERHIGVGLSIADIDRQQLPLPRRDMRPQSIEEQIVAYADLFFSKKSDRPHGPREVERVRAKLGRYGAEKIAIFDAWHARFGLRRR